MIDQQARRPIRVSTDGTAGPYIIVPFDQLEEVVGLLDKAGIKHWVEGDVISVDGKPEVAIVNLGRTGDALRVQAILDGAGSDEGVRRAPRR